MPPPTAAAFGARLRRLLDRLDRDVLAAYRAAGEDFEPRWYAVFIALRDHGPLTVVDLARRLGVSHPAVSQVRTGLERAGLVQSAPVDGDGRRSQLSLTARGEKTAKRLEPLWTAITAAMSGALADHAPALLAELDSLEAALDRRSLAARVAARTHRASTKGSP